MPKTGYSKAQIYWREVRVARNIWHKSKRTGNEETRRVCEEELGKCIKYAVLKIDFLFACLPGSLLFGLALKVSKFWGQCWDACVAVCQVNMGSGRNSACKNPWSGRSTCWSEAALQGLDAPLLHKSQKMIKY